MGRPVFPVAVEVGLLDDALSLLDDETAPDDVSLLDDVTAPDDVGLTVEVCSVVGLPG